jgi:hypothetical protein
LVRFFGWVFYCQPCLEQVHHLEGDEEMLGEAGNVVAIAEGTAQLQRVLALLQVLGNVLHQRSDPGRDKIMLKP